MVADFMSYGEFRLAELRLSYQHHGGELPGKSGCDVPDFVVVRYFVAHEVSAVHSGHAESVKIYSDLSVYDSMSLCAK